MLLQALLQIQVQVPPLQLLQLDLDGAVGRGGDPADLAPGLAALPGGLLCGTGLPALPALAVQAALLPLLLLPCPGLAELLPPLLAELVTAAPLLAPLEQPCLEPRPAH